MKGRVVSFENISPIEPYSKKEKVPNLIKQEMNG